MLWKYFIDGRFHSLGSQVFDEGKHHNKGPEPGYLKSVFHAFEYILTKPLTVNNYQTTHQLACAHFNKEMPDFIIDSSKGGVFRQENSMACSFFPSEIFYEIYPAVEHVMPFLYEYNDGVFFEDRLIYQFTSNNYDIHKNHEIKILIFLLMTLYDLVMKNQIDYIKGTFYYNDKPLDVVYSHEFIFNIFEHMFYGKINYVEMKINERVQLLNKTTNFCKFERRGLLIYTEYNTPNPGPYVENLINEFNKIEKKTKRDIFSLYQQLEWLHPFTDGQGRTDIVILQKLLYENNLPMVMMYDPYLSSYLTIDELLEIY